MVKPLYRMKSTTYFTAITRTHSVPFSRHFTPYGLRAACSRRRFVMQIFSVYRNLRPQPCRLVIAQSLSSTVTTSYLPRFFRFGCGHCCRNSCCRLKLVLFRSDRSIRLLIFSRRYAKLQTQTAIYMDQIFYFLTLQKRTAHCNVHIYFRR